MKLQILSGLNLESGGFHPPETDADVVVLAGDIAHGAHGLRWASHAFDKPVIYVPGNHEFHDFDLGVLDELKQEAAAVGIHLLDRDAIDIGGVRFLGCTLWTDFDLLGPDKRDMAMSVAEQRVDDFQFISDLGRPFTPKLARDIHLADREWLRQRVADRRPPGPTVVVTHHAPHGGHLAQRYRRDPICAAFVSDLESLLGHCQIWVHGSARGHLDYNVCGTRIVANARGSVAERDLFVEQHPFAYDLTVEVGAAISERSLRPPFLSRGRQPSPAPCR